MISKRQKPTLYLPIGLEIISGCKVELLIFSTQRTLYSFIGIQLSSISSTQIRIVIHGHYQLLTVHELNWHKPYHSIVSGSISP